VLKGYAQNSQKIMSQRPALLANLSALALALLLAGCSSMETTEVPAVEVMSATPPEPIFAKPLQPTVPVSKMSAQTMFKVMAAEMLVQKGAVGQAYQVMFELAQENQEAQLAQRAFQLSLQTFSAQNIEQATQLWRELAPQEPTVWRASFLIALRYDNVPLALEQWQRYHELSSEGLEQDLVSAAQRVAASTPVKTGMAFFEALANEYPNEWSAHFALGVVANAYNQVLPAIAALEKSRELSVISGEGGAESSAEPAALNPQINQLLAKLYLQLPTAQTGLDSLARAVEQNPQDWLLQERYARLEVKAEQFEAAEQRYKAILETHPEATTSRLSLALLYMERKAYKEAESHLKQVAEVADYQMVGVYYLGVLYQSQKQYDLALSAFGQIETSNYYVDAQLHIAEIYFAQQGVDKALAVLEAIEAGAAQDQVKVLRAKAIFNTYVKKYNEAIGFYQDALKIEPNHVEVLMAQAMLFYNEKQFSEYEANLSHVLALRPDDVEALNALGYFYAEQAIKLDEAEGLLSRALKLAPDNHFVLDSMGWLYYQQKNYAHAVLFLQKALDIQMDDEILMHLIAALWRNNQQDQARALWEKKHKLFLNNLQLQRIIEQLERKP
jgi:tetratricopeptide (TPR) repeat protein